MKRNSTSALLTISALFILTLLLISCESTKDPCSITHSVKLEKTFTSNSDSYLLMTPGTYFECEGDFVLYLSWANDSVNKVRQDMPYLNVKFGTGEGGQFMLPAVEQVVDSAGRNSWKYSLLIGAKNESAANPIYQITVNPYSGFNITAPVKINGTIYYSGSPTGNNTLIK